MSHPARLSLRAPPHLPFVQGFPGIPASPSRKPAAIHGTLEVRIGPSPLKAKWVRVELRKFESLPPGFPSSVASSEPTWEHVGSIQTLWQPQGQGKEVDTLETADFKFYLALPEDIPSSVDLPRQAGVRYELVAALCYRQKGGVFKKESFPIVKVSEPLRIIKHELHSAWPIYNTPETKVVQAANGQINLTVSRPMVAFGAGDHLQFTVTLKSARPQPFKLRGFECTLLEIITAVPLPPDPAAKSKKHKAPPAPVSKSRPVATVRAAVDESVGLGGEKSSRIDMPVENALVTVRNARSLRVEYELQVKAVTDGLPDKVTMTGIRYTVGPFVRSHAQQAVRDIGHVDTLCPNTPSFGQQNAPTLPSTSPSIRPSDSPRTTSLISHSPSPRPAQAPVVQGFTPRTDFRRQSSATSVTTETTATSAAHDFGGFGAQPKGRAYATMPNSQGRAEVAFPNPQPVRPRSIGSAPASPADSVSGAERYVQSDAGHGEDMSRRYSAMTTATFGRWDRDLQGAINADDEAPDNATESGMGSQVTAKASSAAPPSAPRSSRPSSPPGVGLPAGAGSSRHPPSSFSFLSAEQEKRRQAELYDAARRRAASAQQANGASLVRLGLEADEPPPPEYAPPRPEQPGKYTAPEKSVEEYLSSPAVSMTERLKSDTPPIGSASSSDRENINTTVSLEQSSSRPQQQPSSDVNYMSAEEEKAVQRRRYEAATGRIASAAGGSISGHAPGPSGGSTSSSPITQLSRVGSPMTGTGSSGAIVTSPLQERSDQPLPYDSIFPTAASNSSTAGIITSKNPPVSGDCAVLEKEQMRRFYEAQDRVAQAVKRRSGTAEPNMNDHGPSTSGPSFNADNGIPRSVTAAGSTASAGSSLMNEKEQMRRFYEAQDRVAQAADRRSEGAASSMDGHGPATPGLSALQVLPSRPAAVGDNSLREKEQMRKYYEAQDRVAQARQSGTGSSDGHINALAGSSSSPRTTQGSINSPTRNMKGLSRPGTAAAGGVPLSPVNEKEQIRRYYEAQEKVARAQRYSSGSAPDPASDTVDTPQSSPLRRRIDSSGPASQPGVISAADEKAQMRRYYEALDRVERARNGGGSGSAVGEVHREERSRVSSPSAEDGALPPSFDHGIVNGSSVSTEQNGWAANGTSTASNTIYPSAEEEKDLMKRRYEAAQSHSGQPPSASASPSTPGATLSDANADDLTNTHTNPNSRTSLSTGRSLTARSPPESPLIRDPTVKAGKARAVDSPKLSIRATSALGVGRAGWGDDVSDAGPGAGGAAGAAGGSGAPPPPLPARPPKDYINLLSPVGE